MKPLEKKLMIVSLMCGFALGTTITLIVGARAAITASISALWLYFVADCITK